MAQKTCRVTIQDTDGIDHTAQVTAETLYEALARGIAVLKADTWTNDLTNGRAQISVVDTPVEHSVRFHEFHTWLARPNGSPKDITHRQKIREILAKK